MNQPTPVTTMAAQGDVLFRRVDSLPVGYDRPSKTAIVSSNDSGHPHVIETPGVEVFDGPNPLRSYIVLRAAESAIVVHKREHDTHAPLQLMGGEGAVWAVHRQRESAPDGWRRVED